MSQRLTNRQAIDKLVTAILGVCVYFHIEPKKTTVNGDTLEVKDTCTITITRQNNFPVYNFTHSGMAGSRSTLLGNEAVYWCMQLLMPLRESCNKCWEYALSTPDKDEQNINQVCPNPGINCLDCGHWDIEKCNCGHPAVVSYAK